MSIILDDTNTTAVTYSGVWVLSPSLVYQNGTSHVANSTVNSKATLIFTGTTVRVYGIAFSNQSSYTIDGGNTIFPNATRSVVQFDILLYSSPVLPSGQHNLTIDANNLTIDYFLVTPPGDSSTLSPSSTFLSSSDTQSTVTSLVDPVKTRISAHQKSIIGVVVALAVVAIFTVLGLWLRWRRKNLRKKLESWEVATSVDRPTVQWPATYIPETPPQIIEQPLSPPSYPISEPPPYDAADAEHWTGAPVVPSQHTGRGGVGLTKRGSQGAINLHGVVHSGD